MEALGTMEVSLCRVEPDPIFVYPIPNATYPAKAKFIVTSTARHKIAYKIRYGDKHPKMKVQISVDSKGILSPGQRLGVEVSLMPGYDVVKNNKDSFTLCIYAIPVNHLMKYDLGPRWYKEAAAEDIDFHALDCLIKQQADANGNLPATTTGTTNPEEMAVFDSQMRMDKNGRIYRIDKPMRKGSYLLPQPTRSDKMMIIEVYAQWSDRFDNESVMHDEDPMTMLMKCREYLRESKKKCSDWMEKSRPYLASLTDEAFDIDVDTVSGMSEAYEFRDAFYKTQKNVIIIGALWTRDSSPVCLASGSPKNESDVRGLANHPGDAALLVAFDKRVSHLSVANVKPSRLLQHSVRYQN